VLSARHFPGKIGSVAQSIPQISVTVHATIYTIANCGNDFVASDGGTGITIHFRLNDIFRVVEVRKVLKQGLSDQILKGFMVLLNNRTLWLLFCIEIVFRGGPDQVAKRGLGDNPVFQCEFEIHLNGTLIHKTAPVRPVIRHPFHPARTGGATGKNKHKKNEKNGAN